MRNRHEPFQSVKVVRKQDKKIKNSETYIYNNEHFMYVKEKQGPSLQF